MKLIFLAFLLNAVNLDGSTQKCNLAITFGSVSRGIDNAKANLLRAWIAKHTGKINVDSVSWGREGEMDFCIQYKKIKKTERTQLTKQVKALMKNGNHIFITENKALSHQAKP